MKKDVQRYKKCLEIERTQGIVTGKIFKLVSHILQWIWNWL